MAAVMQEHTDLMQVEVQGHTDDVGNDTFNLELSQARADSVVRWFVENGIDPARLRAVGYGETLPIADNMTDAGRAENRRVEFKLIEGETEA
ncbi:MAG: OmpA family protein, partial [bacterium]